MRFCCLRRNRKRGTCRHCFFNLLLLALYLWIAVVLVIACSISVLVAEEALSSSATGLIANLTSAGADRPGLRLAAEGLSVKHPVVIVPGIVSTALELWKGKPCAQRHFRQRLWGTSLMLQKALLNRECWLQHIAMNSTTGLDPEGIKLRPATGLAAADYFFGPYWVWGRVVENLADVGYDENSMQMASYDWRLSFANLERRDRYFTRLRHQLELLRLTHDGHKPFVVAHSMGALVMLYFLKWVESPVGGNAGPRWVEENVAGVLLVGGPMLGAVKTLSSLLSGEARNTAELSPALRFFQEQLLARDEVARTFRTFHSLPSMLPKGGDGMWRAQPTHTVAGDSPPGRLLLFGSGEATADVQDAADAEDEARYTARDGWTGGEPVCRVPYERGADVPSTCSAAHEDMMGDAGEPRTTGPANVTKCQAEGYERPLAPADMARLSVGAYTAERALALLRSAAPEFMRRVDELYSFGLAQDPRQERYQNDPRYWSNALETTLPLSPNMRIYCLYGVGKATEQGYVYQTDPECSDVPFRINNTASAPHRGVRTGVLSGDGDGTVPLLSLGYMCVRGWRLPQYNPGNVSVTTREYKHRPALNLLSGDLDFGLAAFLNGESNALDALLRGGKGTADHVDILGNYEMIEDLIRVVTGGEPAGGDRILSNIEELVDKVELRPTGAVQRMDSESG